MSSSPRPTSDAPDAPIPDDDNPETDLPLTMTASVVLTSLPLDARAGLATAGEFEKEKVQIRFKAVGGAPILKRPVSTVTATQRFEVVVSYLRRVLKVQKGDSVFLYVNNTFAPALDEVVGNLHRIYLRCWYLATGDEAETVQCFRNQTDDQLVVAYSMTPAFG